MAGTLLLVTAGEGEALVEEEEETLSDDGEKGDKEGDKVRRCVTLNQRRA
jgi:hypothetical protein